MGTWIKLYRKFIEWEWFNISEMVHLYIYMLLKANNEEGTWRGITIKRGQLLTGLKSLNEATGISVRKIRTCLDRLHKTGEIDIQTTNKYSIITINKYDSYQEHRQTNDKQDDKQSTNNRQTIDNKQEYKEEKNNKEYFDFSDSLLALGVEKNIVSDWLKVRKTKKAANTETAFKSIEREIRLSGASANDCIKMAVENSWQGFNAEWYKNKKQVQKPAQAPLYPLITADTK